MFDGGIPEWRRLIFIAEKFRLLGLKGYMCRYSRSRKFKCFSMKETSFFCLVQMCICEVYIKIAEVCMK